MGENVGGAEFGIASNSINEIVCMPAPAYILEVIPVVYLLGLAAKVAFRYQA